MPFPRSGATGVHASPHVASHTRQYRRSRRRAKPGRFRVHAATTGCRARHTHVIGHNIEHLAHPMTLEHLGQRLVVVGSAQLGIKGLMIRNIIAMHTAGPGL